MATAVVEERQLLKAITWKDGFVLALANPGFLFASIGASIGAIGAWAAVLLWSISMIIGLLLAWVYSEMAAMFPEKSGGIALYAHEAWRRYSTLVGPVATFGYWFAWSSVLAIFGLIIANDATANEFAILVQDPERVEAGLKAALQKLVGGFRDVQLRLPCEIAQARQGGAAEIVH